jgi:hypothetical protein
MLENHIIASILSANNLLYNNYVSSELASAVAVTVTVAAKYRALHASMPPEIRENIDDEQIKKQLHHQEFLFRSLFGKIANRAIRLVIKIKENHLPVGPDKTPIKDCTGTTRKTIGIPCIHEISSISMPRKPLAWLNFILGGTPLHSNRCL